MRFAHQHGGRRIAVAKVRGAHPTALHEVLVGKALQKKSFRRRIERAELLIDTGEKRSEGGRRPCIA